MANGIVADVVGSVGVTVVDGSRPYAFVLGSDGHLWLNYWDGQAWFWADQGKPGSAAITGAVGVVTVDGSRPYAFVLGGDGHLWSNYWDGQTWLWADQGKPASAAITGTVGVVTVDGSRPYAFVLGGDGHLWSNYWSGQAWLWSDQGHPVSAIAGAVGAVTVNGNHPSAFVRGSDGHLWFNYWTSQFWLWLDHGYPASGAIASTIGVVPVNADADPYAFVLGSDGHLRFNHGMGTWSDQGKPASTTIAGAVGVVTVNGDLPYAFVLGNDGRLWLNYRSGQAWLWADQGKPADVTIAGAVGVATVNGDRPYAFVRGSDGRLWLNYWNGQAWVWSDQGRASKPLSAGKKKVIINSTAFPNVCLRLDGSRVTQPTDHGDGVVNCQFGAGALEVFNLVQNADTTISFESTAFPNVFLRMDGSNPQSGGGVNAQYGAGQFEKFTLVDQGDGLFGIKSAYFPDCWLYMDGGGINHALPAGGGVVKVYQVAGNRGGPLGKFVITPASPIKHIFVLMLENRSFDSMFGQSGIPGITHATTDDANTANGTVYHVASNAPSMLDADPGHEFQDVVQQLAGANATYPAGGPYPAINNSGFAVNYATSTTEGPPPASGRVGDIMKGFNTPTQLPVIYQLATEFALCDHWFSSLPGPTWPNRFFVAGASSGGLDHSPDALKILGWQADGVDLPNGNIYQRLKNVGMRWRIYNDNTNAYSYFPFLASGGQVPMSWALKSVRLADIESLSHFAADLQGNYPYQYTFIEPHYGDVANSTFQWGSSQHPKDGVQAGECLIKAVYEAIRNSPLWTSSLLIITYDEHGGFYDSVAPGPAVPPADGSDSTNNLWGFKFDRLGVRVPAVIVSPWIARGVVDKTVYDHSSVLATIERNFGFGPLTARDEAANDVLHLLQSSLRNDTPTRLNNPETPCPAPAMAEAALDVPDETPIEKTGNLPGFLANYLKADLALSPGDELSRQALAARVEKITTIGEARSYVQEVSAKKAALAVPDQTPIKKTGNLPGFLAIYLKADLELSPGDELSRQMRIARVANITTVGEARAYIQEISAKIDARRKR